MSNGSLKRKIPNTRAIDGEMYSVKPNVSSGRFLAAAENRPIGTAVAIPAKSNSRNLPLPPVSSAPIPLPSSQKTTSNAIGAMKMVSVVKTRATFLQS